MDTIKYRPYSKIVEVTPAMADEWLAKSAYNRVLNWQEISLLAAAMKRGEWTFNTDLVGFNVKDQLMNGHHRLHAIKLVGKPIEVQVNYGLPVESYAVTDTGRKRSYADRLQLPREVTDVLRLGCAIALNNNKPTVSQMYPYVNAGFQHLVELLTAHCNRRVRVFSSAPMKLAAVVMIMRDKESDYVMTQYRALCEQDYERMSPLAQSLSRQVAMSAGTRTSQWDSRNLLARGCKVFDKARAHHTRLQIMDGEPELYRAMVRDVLNYLKDHHEGPTHVERF